MECEVWTIFAIFDLEIRNILGQKKYYTSLHSLKILMWKILKSLMNLSIALFLITNIKNGI